MTNTARPVLTILMPVRNEGLNLRIMLKILWAVVDVPHEVLVVFDQEGDASIAGVEAVSRNTQKSAPCTIRSASGFSMPCAWASARRGGNTCSSLRPMKWDRSWPSTT